jgi:uracil-DNA glycosylase
MNVKRKATSTISSALTSPPDPKKLKQGSLTAFFGAPKHTVHTASKANFDKQAWINSLTPSQKELLKLEIETLHESWLAALKDELTKPYFLSVCPAHRQV